ncbi:leucine-rich repeat protein [Butyrivibrio sp. AE3004]|uniref:leucine-rich repeat protein n=1 Tax=Butyrivibrio sp. AE3004 TaxID=1506994 RepID=UPI0004941035|nr:leucine-rich repeat protein [Butyrivibrio sp. AE3004]
MRTGFFTKIQSVILAAALAVTIIPTTMIVTEPIKAEAAAANIRENLTDNQKKIFDAYEYLDTRIKDASVEVSVKTKEDLDNTGFYTIYTGAEEKKKYTDEDLKYARRAYVYQNPLNIAGAMAELKFLYLKNKEGKYACYAYLQRTSDKDYTNETKKLKNAVKKIMDTIDDDETNFVVEYQCFNMIIDNVTNVNIAIDNKDLRNTAYGALVTHRASSQGYALAFAALLDAAEISNDILFNSTKCWNQVKIGTKWYETDIVGCDKAKKGKIDYERFNTSQATMKKLGLTRVNFCSKYRTSNGKHKETVNKLQKYDDEVLKDSHNFGLGILNDDGTVTRTTMLSCEQTVKIVPTFKYNSQLYNCSLALKDVVITTKEADSYFKWVGWTKDKPYIELSRGGAGKNRTLSLVLYYDDGSNNGAGSPINVSYEIIDNDDTSGSFVYKITGDNTVSLAKVKQKSIKNVVIPSTVVVGGKNYKVTKIESNAFKFNRKLETVILGSNISEIGSNAFSGKTKLIRVETTGINLNKIGSGAFKSADENTFFLLKAANKGSYNKIVKKLKKSGAKKSVFKYRNINY